MSHNCSNSSSRMKLRPASRRQTSKLEACTLHHRTNIKIYDDNGIDVTPKPLFHEQYPTVDEKQEMTFDIFGLRQESSIAQLMTFPSSCLRSSSLIRSSTFHPSLLAVDERIESSISVNAVNSEIGNLDRAPCSSRWPNYSVSPTYSEQVSIILRETETFYLFEMPQLTADLDTPEGQAVEKENERYDYITVGAGSNRKLANAETQTVKIYMKSRATYQKRQNRVNKGTCVNNWVMYDTFNGRESLNETSRELVGHPNQYRLTKISDQVDTKNPEDQIIRMYEKTSFKIAITTMERIIASNLYIVAQKRFKGIIKPDPCCLDLKCTYSLDLLWTHTHPEVEGRVVSCIRWNYVNSNILAAGYEASAKEYNGILLIWCMKNPNQPDRIYKFDSPISNIDWSRFQPNQLAIGFYDGTLRIIDVSNINLVTLRKISRQSSPTFWPYWQVQWWYNIEKLDLQEQIFTSNQDGTISCYQIEKDFIEKEMMKIPRIGGKNHDRKQMNCCNPNNILISKNPGALLLRQHPTITNVYLVASDEGCVHRCSTNYVHHHVDSFSAHDGPVYSLEYSPFCSKILLTCGADWCIRIWADGLKESLITMSTRMACVRGAAWSPINSTIIATCVNNEICIWDIKRRTYRPTSVTVSPHVKQFVLLEFTKSGDQLVVADSGGIIYIHRLSEMPFPPFDQTSVLVKAIEKSIVVKPELMKKLQKLGEPFQ